jgi:hypothetical protein
VLLADYDAPRRDDSSALSGLEAADVLQGALPPEYDTTKHRM